MAQPLLCTPPIVTMDMDSACSIPMDKEGELGNQPTVATLSAAVAAPCSPDPDKNKHGLACIAAGMKSLLLQPTLREAIIADSGIEPDKERQLREQCGAALESR